MENRQDNSKLLANRWFLLGSLSIVFITYRLYSPVLKAHFCLDDILHLHIAKLGIGFIKPFIHDYMLGAFYRPVGYALFKLNYLVSGLNPMGYYIVNIALLSLIGILLLTVLLSLKIDWKIGLTSSFLFIISPITATATLWISGRYDLISTTFMLLSILLYIRFHIYGRLHSYIFSLLFAMLAFFSKEASLCLPLLLLGVYSRIEREVTPFRERTIGAFVLLGPYIALAVLYLAVRFIVLDGIGGYRFIEGFNINNYRLIYGFAITSFIAKAFLIIIAVLLIMIVFKPRTRTSRLGSLWLIASLLPLLPLYKTLSHPDMYLFLPLRFFFLPGLVLAILLSSNLERAERFNIETSLISFRRSLRDNIRLYLSLFLLAFLFIAELYYTRGMVDDWVRDTNKEQEATEQIAKGFDFSIYPDGNCFVIRDKDIGLEVDARLKLFYGSITQRFLFLHDGGANQVIVKQGQGFPFVLPWAIYLRRNPVMIDKDYLIGVVDIQKGFFKEEIDKGMGKRTKIMNLYLKPKPVIEEYK